MSIEQSSQGFTLNAKTIALILIVVGLVISGYLSYVKLLDAPIICTENQTFSCNTVQASRWSELMGIPIAYLGFGLYALLGTILLLEDRIVFLEEYATLLVFTGGLIGWVFSMWLVYIQAVIIQAYCQWCLAHEFNFTLLFGVILYMTWQHLSE